MSVAPALCQARTLQLTVPVYFLKRRLSTLSHLRGCREGSAHSCICLLPVTIAGEICDFGPVH